MKGLYSRKLLNMAILYLIESIWSTKLVLNWYQNTPLQRDAKYVSKMKTAQNTEICSCIYFSLFWTFGFVSA